MLGIIISCVAAFVIFLAISYAFGFYKTEYNPSKLSHNIVIFLSLGILIAGATVIYSFLAKDNFIYPYLRPLKSMTQSLVAESVSISAPDRSSFDIKA